MKKQQVRAIAPTKFRPFGKNVFGFDIETSGEKNDFICASIWCEHFQRSYLSRDDFLEDMRYGIFDDAVIVATNLSFDFFGTFFGTELIGCFDFVFRGSDLISATTYRQKTKFFKEHDPDENRAKILFTDTLNYAKMSVESLGKLVGSPKMEKPANLGTTPSTDAEWRYLFEYNKNDAMVTQRAMLFFISAFQDLGANFKLTLASTAMSLFTNKYLKGKYYVHGKDVLLDILKGYYGGRTEAFHRGKISGYHYYDVNSLYPTMMCKELPNPNSLCIWKQNLNPEMFRHYTGMSLVDVECPLMKYPLLPYRTKRKLYFPIGRWTGWYTHAELAEAMDAGYIIHRIEKSYVYKETCQVLKPYVEALYALRLHFKEQKSPMELVVKILMNGLYGKFAQKFDKRETFVHSSDRKELDTLKASCRSVEVLNFGFYRIVKDTEPKNFSFPIWSAYITAYGRIHLWRLIRDHNAIYCDTDSLFCKDAIAEGKGLGELKEEAYIEDGIIVKPKLYFYRDRFTGKEVVKTKGIHKVMNEAVFLDMLGGSSVTIKKFMKFKESLRRKGETFTPNQVYEMKKVLDLEDDKRRWPSKFNARTEQESRPLSVEEITIMEDKAKS